MRNIESELVFIGEGKVIHFTGTDKTVSIKDSSDLAIGHFGERSEPFPCSLLMMRANTMMRAERDGLTFGGKKTRKKRSNKSLKKRRKKSYKKCGKK